MNSEQDTMSPKPPPTTSRNARILPYHFKAWSACLHEPVAPHTQSGTISIRPAMVPTTIKKERM